MQRTRAVPLFLNITKHKSLIALQTQSISKACYAKKQQKVLKKAEKEEMLNLHGVEVLYQKSDGVEAPIHDQTEKQLTAAPTNSSLQNTLDKLIKKQDAMQDQINQMQQLLGLMTTSVRVSNSCCCAQQKS